ncbi:MAG: hypothetical protein IPK59_17065 [Rhodospirillaceae bacterium]|nr:hypothetical protein [Rhodospirillaceae bacterium]
MMRLLGATLSGVIFCFVGPPFALLAMVGLGTLYFMRIGYTGSDALRRFIDMMDQLSEAIGLTATLVLLLGLCAVAALSAGIAAARITRPYAYVASSFIILICAGTLLFIGRRAPEPLYLWLFILGGTVSVLVGAWVGGRTYWPDPRPTSQPAPRDRA